MSHNISFHGLPGCRIVDSKPNSRTVCSRHSSSPNGLTRFTLCRIAASSSALWGSLTNPTQSAGQVTCQALSSAMPHPFSRRHKILHSQASARCTKLARRGLRSIYRKTSNKWASFLLGPRKGDRTRLFRMSYNISVFHVRRGPDLTKHPKRICPFQRLKLLYFVGFQG